MNLLRKSALIIAAACALSASAYTLDLPTETINGKTYYVYRVAPKETIYSITRKLGITRDQLIAANPSVADGLRADAVLIFPMDAEPSQPAENSEISEISENSDNSQNFENSEISETAESPESPETAESPESPESPETAVPEDSLTVAVVLPFMLESESITKSADNFTNFYRGFLLATDLLSAQSELPIKIMAFDSEGSVSKVENLMTHPEVRDADFIISPDDAPSIEAMAAIADSTNALVLNLFAVKNNAHRNHESLFQGNISHDLMYSSAIDGFCNANKQKKAILLNATDIPAEKSEFTKQLTAKLVTAGIPYEQLNYAGKLTEQDLAALTHGKDYVFIPTSHSREALMRFLPALEEYRDSNPSTTLFGYPEWIVLQGDIKEKLHRLNTTIYSRFIADCSSTSYKRIAAAYESTYGQPLDKSLPVSALLGFDTAAWILNAATMGVGTSYQGTQNAFKFIEVDGGGNENSALFFITFTPEGSTEAILL